MHQLNITKDYYVRSLRSFERNADLLDFYAGYLDYVENSFSSKDVYMRASKAREEQNKKSALKEDEAPLVGDDSIYQYRSTCERRAPRKLSFDISQPDKD